MVADLGRISIVGAWDKVGKGERFKLATMEYATWFLHNVTNEMMNLKMSTQEIAYDIVIYDGKIELRKIARLQVSDSELKRCSWKQYHQATARILNTKRT